MCLYYFFKMFKITNSGIRWWEASKTIPILHKINKNPRFIRIDRIRNIVLIMTVFDKCYPLTLCLSLTDYRIMGKSKVPRSARP